MRMAVSTVSCCSLYVQGRAMPTRAARMASTSVGAMATAPMPTATTMAATRATARSEEPEAAPAYGASSGCSSRARSAMALPVRGPKPSR